MKPLIYAVSILLIGLGNAIAADDFLRFFKDSSLPGFSFSASKEGVTLAQETVRTIRQSTGPTRTIMAYTAQQRPVHAYFFPGSGTGYAMVVGGMHGSELSSIEVAKAVIDSLANGKKPFYNVLVIPELFPDNAALAASIPAEIGSPKNIGRYTTPFSADPNRQMPPLGSSFLPDRPIDFAGRTIEGENQALLHLVQQLKPQKIASIHAIRNTALAGVFADPRTDAFGYAHGFEADSLLAVKMAQHIEIQGGSAPGNNLCSLPSALYYSDPAVAPKGQIQKRTIQGGHSGHVRGFGISLGSWASTTERVYEESEIPRTAAMVFTVEFPGSRRTLDYSVAADKLACQRNVQAYASAIVSVLLQEEVK